MSISAEKKISNGVTKKIFKDSIRGMIPDSIIDRKKVGFGIPIEGWLKDKLGDRMRNTVLTFLKETDLFDVNYVMATYDRYTPIQRWCLYNLANWWKIYIA